MAFKTISGTVELATGAFTPSETSPVYQLENGATLLSLDLENSGSPYTLGAGENAYVKMYFTANNTETAYVLMDEATGNVSVELTSVLTAIAGQAVAFVKITGADDALLFSCKIPIPILRTSGTSVTSYEEPAAGTVAELEAAIAGKIDKYSELPTAAVEYLGIIAQFTGETDVYTNGYFYICQSDGESGYEWAAKDVMSAGASVAHNDTTSKQGGTTNEYYHLTSAQYTVVENTSGTNTGDQAAGDFNHDDLANISGTPSQYNHPTDAQMTVLGNTSGTNTGDQTLPTRDSLGLDTDDTVTFANLSGTNTGDETPSDANPAMNGAAAPGTSNDYSRADHVHPSDTSKAGTAVASTSANGLSPQATAPAVGMRNVLAIDNAETARSDKALFDATDPSTQAFGDAAVVGTAMTAARSDHKHAMPAAQTLSSLGAQAAATITENSNAAPALGTIANNTEYRCTHSTPTAAPTMTIAAIAANTTEFACNVIYKAEATTPSAPAVTNNSGKTIKYQGDGVAAGTFTPVGGTVYRLGWVWDGLYLNCYIKGV